MDIEVVDDQVNGLGSWILKSQSADDFGELETGPVGSVKREMTALLGFDGFDGADYIGSAAALVLAVLTRLPSGNCWRRRPHFSAQRD